MKKKKNAQKSMRNHIDKELNDVRYNNRVEIENVRKKIKKDKKKFGIENKEVINIENEEIFRERKIRTKFYEDSKLIKALNKGLLIGKFVGNERGFGFVEIEGREEDIFIAPSDTKNAMHGDIVAVRIVHEKEGNRRAEGIVSEVF